MRTYRASFVFAAMILTASSAYAQSAQFTNGTTLGNPREGFINMRTDLDGNPDDPNDGTETMTVGLGPDDSWVVRISQGDVSSGRLQFHGSTANQQSGTGSIVITFTAIRVTTTRFITVDVTTAIGTFTLTPKITPFIIRPVYQDLEVPVNCGVLVTGPRNEAATVATTTPACRTTFQFEHCARACNIRGDVSSSGPLRQTVVSPIFGSNMRLATDPVHQDLTGKTANAGFFATESFRIAGVRVRCTENSGGQARWRYILHHTTNLPGVTPPADQDRSVVADCPAAMSSPQHPDDTLPNETIVRGITTGQETSFTLNSETFNFYRAQNQHTCRAAANGSSSVGNVTYHHNAGTPFFVLLIPRPLF